MGSNPIAVTYNSWWKSIHHVKLIAKLLYRSSRSQMFLRIGVLTNFTIFTGKHLFNKISGLKESNFIKKRLIQYRCFPVNIAKFQWTDFFTEYSGGCFCTSATTVLENRAGRDGKKRSHDKFSYNYLGSYNYLMYYLFCIVVLAVENSRKPLFFVAYRNQVFYVLISNEREKNNKKEKFHALFFNMTWSVEMKYNTYTYDIYNYDIKKKCRIFYIIIKSINFL